MSYFLGCFREKPYFCREFLRILAFMIVNHWLRILSLGVVLLTVSLTKTQAQTTHCKDTAEHRRLQTMMWDVCAQDSQLVVYEACLAFHQHAKEDGDQVAATMAWVCGIMYNLGFMNIQDAYHLTQLMKQNIEEENAEEERFYVPFMMGHVYNTCGNIPGAQEELLKAEELIKGTSHEADGLGFIYLALAHVHLNHNLEKSLHWVDEAKQTLERFKESPLYYRCLSDVYAVEAIVHFKQHDSILFHRSICLMEQAYKRNTLSSNDLFVPYARIYQTLLSGDAEKALAETATLRNKKEQYLLECDIYRYIGDNEKAILTQRELMHKRDSITGVMINENIHQQEQEIALMKEQQEMSRKIYLILIHTVILAILAIVLMARNIMMRRKYQKQLIAKNQELREANRQVTAANEMKTEFIRSVSHEIRTPLNIINGFSQVLTDVTNTFEPEERSEIADTISENSHQITSLVNKMLALANENTTNLMSMVEETDAVEICQRAIEEMPKTDPAKLKVVFENHLPLGETRILTHGDSLAQMLGNMLENSVKFTEQGQITLTLKRDKTHFRFVVEDTGCGIPADKVDTIFERFTKVDEFKWGLGLGLAYCHETVEKLGGNLTLDKTSDEGTTFTLSLPIKLKQK